MNVSTKVNIYDLINTSPKTDVAGILATAAYAIRESITFLDAWQEMGFGGIDINLLVDMDSDHQLTLVALACVSLLSRQVQTDD